MIQSFVVLGIAKGQGRPRACIRGRHAGMYERKEDTQHKSNIAAQIVAQKPVLIEKGEPIKLQVCFYMTRPKGHYNSKGMVKERFMAALPVGKPDLDNQVKALKDACKGIVWHDDAQVVSMIAWKRYGNVPQTRIMVSDITVEEAQHG